MLLTKDDKERVYVVGINIQSRYNLMRLASQPIPPPITVIDSKASQLLAFLQAGKIMTLFGDGYAVVVRGIEVQYWNDSGHFYSTRTLMRKSGSLFAPRSKSNLLQSQSQIS